MYAWTYQLHPLSVDPAHPPVGGLPAPGKTIGGSDLRAWRQRNPPSAAHASADNDSSSPGETSAPRVSMPQASILLMVRKGSWLLDPVDLATAWPSRGIEDGVRAAGGD